MGVGFHAEFTDESTTEERYFLVFVDGTVPDYVS